MVGERIRILRLQRNMSLESLSDELQISVSTLSNLERGETEMTITRLAAILKCLGVGIVDFFEEVETGRLLGVASDVSTGYRKSQSDIEQLNRDVRQLRLELERLKIKGR